MANTVTARGPSKVVAVIDPAELLDVQVPDRQAGARADDSAAAGTADLAAKSVRRAIAAVSEHGAENVTAVLQGRLVGDQITEAGVMVQPKVPKPEKAEAAA